MRWRIFLSFPPVSLSTHQMQCPVNTWPKGKSWECSNLDHVSLEYREFVLNVRGHKNEWNENCTSLLYFPTKITPWTQGVNERRQEVQKNHVCSYYVLHPGIGNTFTICFIGILLAERKLNASGQMEPLLTVEIKSKSIKSWPITALR